MKRSYRERMRFAALAGFVALWTAAGGWAAPVASAPRALAVQALAAPAAAPARDATLDRQFDALTQLAERLRVVELPRAAGGLPKLRAGTDVSKLAVDLLAAGAELRDLDALQKVAQGGDAGGVDDGRRGVLRDLGARHATFVALLDQLQQAEAKNDAQGRYRAVVELARLVDAGSAPRASRFDPIGVRGQQGDTKKLRQPLVKAQDFASKLSGAALRAAAPDTSVHEQATGALDAPPAAADLAETDEVTFTAQIRAKADELGRNPVAIRNWVYNNIDFAPSYGSTQNATRTLLARRGNAYDINSLLIALLRASNVPARYVYGSVDIPVERATEWLAQAPNATVASDLLSKSGIPTTVVTSGGVVKFLRIEHVWVEAYVDFVPSRGARNLQPDSWVPLDASYKRYRDVAPVAYAEHVDYDPAALQAELLTGAQQGNGWITGVDPNVVKTVYDRLDRQALDYVTAHPAADPADTFGARHIVTIDTPLLEGSLPYRVASAQTLRYSALPASLQQKINVNLYASEYDASAESPQFEVSLPLAKLGTGTLQVEYRGASAADTAAIQAAAASNAEFVSASSLHVVPTLLLGTQVLAQGSAVGYGTPQFWRTFIGDPLGVFATQNEPSSFPAGTAIAFVADPVGTTPEYAEAMTAGYGNTQNLSIGDALALGGMQFWVMHDLFDSWVARSRGVAIARMPSVGAFATALRVSYFFGVPRTATTRGFTTDIKAVRYAVAASDPEQARRAMLQAGAMGSFSEGATWRILTGGDASQSLSAATLLLRANEAKIPLHLVDSTNVDAKLAVLQLAADDKDDIRNAINAGLQVLTPERESNVGGWSGVGYLIVDPNTGTGVWRVSGGLNGGIDVGCIAKAISLNVLCKLMFNRLLRQLIALTNPGALVAMLAERLIISLIPVVGQIIAIVQLALMVAQVTMEVIRWVKSIESEIESLSQADLSQLGIADLNDALCSLGSPCFDSNFFDDIKDNWTWDGFKDGFSGNFMGGAFGAGGPSVGNPVSVGNGIKWQWEQDYQGVGPFPLAFIRTYNSAIIDGSVMGNKWTHSYMRSVRVAPAALEADQTPSAPPNAVLVTHADGTYFQFVRRNNAYVGENNLPERIVRFADANDITTAWEVTTLADELEHYDGAGRLQWIRNRAGLKQTLTYNGAGQLQQVADDFGRTLKFTYYPSGQLETLTDPDAHVITYSYDGIGNAVAVTYADGKSRKYHYEDFSLHSYLTGLTDERNVRLATWAYDYKGRAILSTHGNDADKHVLHYGENETTVTDPVGTTRTYTFTKVQERPYLTKVTQACSACSQGGTAELGYDGNGFVNRRKDFNGNVTTVVRNARGLEESRTEAAGTPLARTITTTWNTALRLPATITEPTSQGSRTITFGYDAAGNRTSHAVSIGGVTRTWTWTYNGRGQPLTADGPRSDVNDGGSATYDAATGTLSSVTDQNGQTTTYPLHDASGRVKRKVDPNGLITDYDYDARGRLVAETTKTSAGDTGEKTQYRYLASGEIDRVTNPDGSWQQYTYDDALRVTDITDSLGNRYHITRDNEGNATKEEVYDATGALAHMASRVYDTLGRLQSTSGALPGETTAYTYDGNGNDLTITDPLNHVTTNSYDAFERLTQVDLLAAGDPQHVAVSYGYDANDNLNRVTDARNVVTNYVYNGFDELTTTTSPDTGTTTQTYDTAGNIASQTDARNQRGVYQYDRSNRLTQVQFGPANAGTTPGLASVEETLRFAYDESAGGAGAQGRLTTASDGAGTTTYVYDKRGRQTQRTQKLGTGAAALTRTTSMHYDAFGRVDERTTPSGAVISYGYGADGRVVRITVNGVVIVRDVEYFPFGEVKGWTEGAAQDAFRYARSFDTDGRITGYTVGAATRTLSFDAASRITALADAPALPAAANWTYGYDAQRRLTSATNAATQGGLAALTLGWTYDANGNRTQETRTQGGPTQTIPYTIAPDSNRLTQVGAAARTYLDSGTTASDGQFRYNSSARNRITVARTQGTGAVVARYAYNAFGQRVCKATGDSTCPQGPGSNQAQDAGSGTYTQYAYDEAGHLLGEYDTTGALLAEHVWLDDVPVAVLKPTATAATQGGVLAGNVAAFFVEPDHLDTPRAIVNATHQTVWRWDSTPFGDTLADERPTAAISAAFVYGLRFPGQQYDAETSTYYNVQRDYEPDTGRYLQSDPIGLDGGMNTYAYVDGGPLEYDDIDGLKKPGTSTVERNRRRGKKYEYKFECWLKNLPQKCKEVKGQQYVPVPGYSRGRFFDFECIRPNGDSIYIEVKTGGSNTQRQNDKDDALRKYEKKKIAKFRKCKNNNCPGGGSGGWSGDPF